MEKQLRRQSLASERENFKFISRQWKSEHLTENLSDSLNIYVDLFQLIDFLSMLLQKYVFCNAIRYKIAEKKSKRKIYLRSVMFTSCSALSPPSHFLMCRSSFSLQHKRLKDEGCWMEASYRRWSCRSNQARVANVSFIERFLFPILLFGFHAISEWQLVWVGMGAAGSFWKTSFF